jgi:diguanylate cyclase (GGDEF)-like protein
MAKRWTVLIVSSNMEQVAPLQAALEKADGDVVAVSKPSEAYTLLVDEGVDVALLDASIPADELSPLVDALRSDQLHIPVVIFSDFVALEDRLAAFEAGANDFFALPMSAQELSARVRCHVLAHQKVVALEARVRQLHELSLTDGLTKVANYRSFEDRLGDEFRRALRYDEPLALLLIDIDHFKAINDQHGHQVGDLVLVDFAKCVRAAVRETDFVARYGGEEFAVLLPKTQLAGALTVADRVYKGVHQLRTGPKGSLRVTASFGLSSFPDRLVTSGEKLLRTADEALYRSKRQGRDQISIYQPPFADTLM